MERLPLSKQTRISLARYSFVSRYLNASNMNWGTRGFITRSFIPSGSFLNPNMRSKRFFRSWRCRAAALALARAALRDGGVGVPSVPLGKCVGTGDDDDVSSWSLCRFRLLLVSGDKRFLATDRASCPNNACWFALESGKTEDATCFAPLPVSSKLWRSSWRLSPYPRAINKHSTTPASRR